MQNRESKTESETAFEHAPPTPDSVTGWFEDPCVRQAASTGDSPGAGKLLLKPHWLPAGRALELQFGRDHQTGAEMEVSRRISTGTTPLTADPALPGAKWSAEASGQVSSELS